MHVSLYEAVYRRIDPRPLLTLVPLIWVVTTAGNLTEAAGIATSAFLVRVAIGQKRTMPAAVVNSLFLALIVVIFAVALPLCAYWTTARG